jgi:hypothetical protein
MDSRRPWKGSLAAWMAAVKPHGWFHAALGMGGARPSNNKVNRFFLVGYFSVIYA